MIINYEALDKNGMFYIRPVQIISELPGAGLRLQTLDAFSQAIGVNLYYGEPVYIALGYKTKSAAAKHKNADILLTKGCDLPVFPNGKPKLECVNDLE